MKWADHSNSLKLFHKWMNALHNLLLMFILIFIVIFQIILHRWLISYSINIIVFHWYLNLSLHPSSCYQVLQQQQSRRRGRRPASVPQQTSFSMTHHRHAHCCLHWALQPKPHHRKALSPWPPNTVNTNPGTQGYTKWNETLFTCSSAQVTQQDPAVCRTSQRQAHPDPPHHFPIFKPGAFYV